MFEKFGEFDSCEEINMAAQGLYEEGDTKAFTLSQKKTDWRTCWRFISNRHLMTLHPAKYGCVTQSPPPSES